jgi:NTE family protein
MGGLIAAGYASGMTPDDLEREALAASRPARMMGLAEPGLGQGGLIAGEHLLRYFEQLLGARTFSDMRLPLALVAVDLESRQTIVLQEGSVALAVRATTSVPGLFAPVKAGGRRLVDGGVLDNLPVDVVRRMGADLAIGVDVGANGGTGAARWLGCRPGVPRGLSQAMEVLDSTMGAMLGAIQDEVLRRFPPDVWIQPGIPAEVNSIAGYQRVAELTAIGERAAEARLSEIFRLLRPSAGPSSVSGTHAPA